MNIIGNELRHLRGRQVEQQQTYENNSPVRNRNDQNGECRTWIRFTFESWKNLFFFLFVLTEEVYGQQTQMSIMGNELKHLREKQMESFERTSAVKDGDDHNGERFTSADS